PLGAYLHRTSMSAEDLARLEEQLGMNDPIYVQYGHWLKKVVTFDFGQSTTERRPVTEAIMERLPNTIYLMLTAWVVTVIVAIPIGVISAIKQYSWFDHLVTTLTFVGQSIPNFWLGLILILI